MEKPTEASLVAASDQHPPLLRLRRIGLDRCIDGLLPVVQSQDVHLLCASLGLYSLSVIMSAGVGDVGAKVAQEVLELGLVLVEGAILSGRKQRQGQEDRGCRETHLETGAT